MLLRAGEFISRYWGQLDDLTRKRLETEPNPYRGVKDQALLREILARTCADVAGVRRLDQQLIYAPLGAAAALVYSVASNRGAFLAANANGLLPWMGPAAILVVLLVGVGLVRNQMRHVALLERQAKLLRALEIHDEVQLDFAFHIGRPLYLSLFGVGFSGAMAALVRLLADPPS